MKLTIEPKRQVQSKLRCVLRNQLGLYKVYEDMIFNPKKSVVNMSWLYDGVHVYKHSSHDLTKALVYWNKVHLNVQRLGFSSVQIEQEIYIHLQPIIGYIMSTLFYGLQMGECDETNVNKHMIMDTYVSSCLAAIVETK